jgi:hypothetical protein
MSYKSKYLHYKLKYLNLKNPNNIQTGGTDNKYDSSQSESDSFAEYEIDKDALSSESSTENKKRKEFEKHKTDPGRGLLGDALYYWVVNTGINKDDPSSKKKTWKYEEPVIEDIEPEVVQYTEFDEKTLSILYNHSRSEYDEGFDIGYIVGYECGCNQNKNPDKKEPPGNISVPEFLSGFYDGWKLGFYKGTKYYYTTWIQINNNNYAYKKSLINYVVSGQQNTNDNYLEDKTDPNYDEIEERSFNDYYVFLKKKIMGKTHYLKY